MQRSWLVSVVVLLAIVTMGHNYLPPQPSRSDPTLALRWNREVQRAHDVLFATVVSDSLEGPGSIKVVVERSFKGAYTPGTFVEFVVPSSDLFPVEIGGRALLFLRPSFTRHTPDVTVDPIHSAWVSGDSLRSHCPLPSPNTLASAEQFIGEIVQKLQVSHLTEASDIVLKGTVRDLLDCEQIKYRLNAWCTVQFEVHDVLYASEDVSGSITFTTLATSMRKVPGTLPRLDVGDEVIVFLSRMNNGELALLPGVGIYAAWVIEGDEAGVRYRENAFSERVLSRTSTSTIRTQVVVGTKQYPTRFSGPTPRW
jgi:hypothetical protein